MKTVAGAVIIKKGLIFLARRKPGQTLNGFWEFPGGKLEQGETIQQCLERELFEEFGISTTAGEVIAESVYHYDHGTFKLMAVLTEIHDEENLSLTVHDQTDWVSFDNLLNYHLAPADIPVAKKIKELFAPV